MSAPDEGLFGPGSVTWRLHADPTLIVGGLRALFLQSLHPTVVAAVMEHSDFRTDPWGRLMRTAEYVGTVSFGTTREARRAAARVRGMHRRVPGAGDPELLLWVHCCEIDSFLDTARRGGLRLSPADADRYVMEQTRAALLVGAEEGPRSAGELRDYFTGLRPQLAMTPPALEAARYVLRPPMHRAVRLGTPARPAWAGLASLGFALLPRWARRMYRLPGLPTTDLAATAAVFALRAGLLAVPPVLRDGPHVKEAKARIAVG